MADLPVSDKSIVFQDDDYRRLFHLEDHHWFFQARRDILAHLLRHFAFTGGATLDLGCGTGTTTLQLADHSQEVVALDLSLTALRLAQQRAITNLTCADGTRLPFPDQAFDLVTALDVIEHIADDVGALREVHRTLRPGGLCVVFVPAYQFLWSNMDTYSHHARRYTRRLLVEQFRQAGLQVRLASYINSTLLPAVVAVRLLRRLSPPPEDHLPEMEIPPAWLNSLLRKLMAAESHAATRLPLPFGGSVIAVGQRP